MPLSLALHSRQLALTPDTSHLLSLGPHSLLLAFPSTPAYLENADSGVKRPAQASVTFDLSATETSFLLAATMSLGLTLLCPMQQLQERLRKWGPLKTFNLLACLRGAAWEIQGDGPLSA